VTGPVILDASAAVPLVREEPESHRWRATAAGWLRDGRSIIVPVHFWLEVSNTLVTRHRVGSVGVIEALHALDDVITETADVARPALLLAIDRAERLGLSVYDAAYLALAEVLDGQLATMDRALGIAAGGRLLIPVDRPLRLSETAAPYGSPARVMWPDYAGAAAYLGTLRAELKRATPASRPAGPRA
jgi:predicted nucleic acid-binding protein